MCLRNYSSGSQRMFGGMGMFGDEAAKFDRGQMMELEDVPWGV